MFEEQQQEQPLEEEEEEPEEEEKENEIDEKVRLSSNLLNKRNKRTIEVDKIGRFMKA